MSVLIVVQKSRNRLAVYKNGRMSYSTYASHAGKNTRLGRRKIVDWVWGAVSSRKLNFFPNTWFSFGDTFGEKKLKYSAKWPPVGVMGTVRCYRGTFKAIRTDKHEAKIWWSGKPNPFPIWTNSNPYGVLAAKLSTLVWLHGTALDRNGKEHLGPGVAGCVKVSNAAIRYIKTLAPKGSIVSIEP